MTKNNKRILALLLSMTCMVFSSSIIAADQIVGNPAIGTDTDSTGNAGDIIYDETSALVTIDGTLSSWSFYDDDDFSPERIITPLIIRNQAGIFSITGIGQTRTTTELGLQEYPFNLQSGTDRVFNDGTYFFGFRHGSSDGSTINLGVADTVFSGNTSRYFVLGNAATPVGPLIAGNSSFAATYSYNGTVGPSEDATAVPSLSE